MIIRFRNFVTCVLFFIGFWASSQNVSIKGKVVDANSTPIALANVIIVELENKGFVTGTSTNDDGSFELIVTKGSYELQVTFIGFKNVEQVIDIDQDMTLQNIVLIEDVESLGEVSIIAKKPSVVRKADRLVFNVASTALTEGSTLQVLKSTPGVIVTEGVINIKSAPADVYINGRKVQLTTDEVIQLLESAPANTIQSVEVITNPPASYDADSGSVINIVMSKNIITGYRGSVFGNYTQGVFPRYNVGTSHFFKNDKLNLNLNYNYINQKINRKNEERIDYLNNDLSLNEIWNSNIDRVTRSETHNLNLNFDYFISEGSTLSLNSTGIYTPYYNYAIKNNTDIFNNTENFQSRFTSDNLSQDDKYNIGTDLIFDQKINDKSSLSIAAHYTTYNYERNQNVLSNFYDQNNQFTNDSEFRTAADQATEIINGKLDYQLNTSSSATFEAGFKYSNVNTDSSIFRYNFINGSESLDTSNSNIFDYDEKVYAGYLNFSKSWDKVELNLGIRAEQTNVLGESITLNQVNTQDYLEWFPNASLSFNISDDFSLYGNYKRSITRPNYATLNPFTLFLNENTIVVGNPNLQPTFKDHFVFGTSFLKHFTFEAYYIYYDGAIEEIIRQDNTTNIISYVPVNLDKTLDYGFDLSFSYYNNRWNLYAVNSTYRIEEETRFGADFVNLSQWSNLSIVSNGFSLLKDYSLNINLDLTYITKNLQRFFIVEDQLYSSLFISKSIWNKKAVLSLVVEDIFNMQDARTRVNYLNQSSAQFNNFDNRLIKLGFRYNFGNTKLNTNERATDVEERNRLTEQGN